IAGPDRPRAGIRRLYRPHDELDGFAAGPRADAAPPARVESPSRATLRARLEQRFHALDLVHDLAEEIGTRRWYRGMGTMLALGAVALAFWPDFSAVEAATGSHPDDAVRRELRGQAIAPLALGAGSGLRTRADARVIPLAGVPERASLQMVATLGEGDSLGQMLQRAGVGIVDAAQASQMVAAVMPLSDVKAGTQFAITLGSRAAPGEPRTLDRLTFRARFDLDLAIARQNGGLGIARQPVAVDATPLRVRGTVGASLFRSARAAGAPMKAIEQYLQTLAAHVSLDGGVTPSDQFDMIVAYKRSANGENQVGDLVYAGLEREGKPVAELVRWKDGQFVDAANSGGGMMAAPAQVLSGGMIMPVNGRMTSPFGARRHPILGYVRMHAGVDFGAAWGSPIFATGEGVVSFAGRHGGHGNYVRIEHGGGLGSGYGHMSRIAVSPGARVSAGQVIGYVGSTGLSTGPHLHYEVYQHGRTVNPLSVSVNFKTVGGAPAGMEKGQLDALKGKIAQLKGVAPGAALQKLSPKYPPVKALSGKVP
ncbi:MAG: M23 family metallopeptidase, partial [Novosphingobium sp.]